MSGLNEALQWLWSGAFSWLRSVVSPAATLNELLSKPSDDERLAAGVKLWVTAFLFSAVLTFPALEAFGIKWNNVGFHLVIWFTLIIGWIAIGFLLHTALIALKLKSDFWLTLIMFITPNAAFSPLFFLVSMPGRIETYSILKNLKAQQLSFVEMIPRLLVLLYSGENFYVHSSLLKTTSTLQLMIIIAVGVIVAEAISQWYRNDRLRSYLCVTLAYAIGLVVLVLLSPFSLMAFYSFAGS